MPFLVVVESIMFIIATIQHQRDCVSPCIKVEPLMWWVDTWNQPRFSCPAAAYAEAPTDDRGATAICPRVPLIEAFLTCITSAPKTVPSKNNLIQNIAGRVPLAQRFLCNTLLSDPVCPFLQRTYTFNNIHTRPY